MSTMALSKGYMDWNWVCSAASIGTAAFQIWAALSKARIVSAVGNNIGICCSVHYRAHDDNDDYTYNAGHDANNVEA